VNGINADFHIMEIKTNNRQSMSKVRAARQQKRRYPFTPKTRLFDLTTASSHTTLAEWLAFIAPYLQDGKVPDWKTATRLDFRCSKERIAWCIAVLLDKIGNDGLKCKKSVFFRYLTSSEHSNINIPEGNLKTLVNNHLRDGIRPLI
jgi:hypothetical protein